MLRTSLCYPKYFFKNEKISFCILCFTYFNGFLILNLVGGHVPVSYGQFGPCPPGYSNPNPGIYPTQQNGELTKTIGK